MVTNRVQEGVGRFMLAPYLLMVGWFLFDIFLLFLFSVLCVHRRRHGWSSPVRLERVKFRKDVIGWLCFVVGEGSGLCHM